MIPFNPSNTYFNTSLFFSRRAMALILDDALAASFIVPFDRGSQPANKFFILFLASNKLA